MKFENNLTDVAKTDRFFVYLWSYDGWVGDMSKFGDTWVPSGKCAFTKCLSRVRESAQVLKHEFDAGRMKIHAIWDVSDYARKHGKFKMHGKVDTTIGDEVGFRIKDDMYQLSPEDMVVKVNGVLKKAGQPLKKCGLTAWQYRAVCESKGAFEDGATTILADMCARAGKTLYIAAMAIETKAPITVVASYVLTSFVSFIGDISSFEQFKNVVLIDSKDVDYKEKVLAARKAGKQVVIFLSLCKGGLKKNKRSERIKFLFNLDEQVLLVIDEADYGAWKPGQCDPLVKHRRENDRVILMTGTNADRAVGGWDVDEVIQVTYLEMLMEKKVAA